MNDEVTVVIQGVGSPDEVPGLESLAGRAQFRCASSLEALHATLPGAEVMLGWNFRADDLEAAWSSAGDLRWIHWCGAGVDALLFPALVNSDVQVTNARTIFDRPMAEYALGLVLAMAKGFPRTLKAQAEARWDYRVTENIAGSQALVVGAGSIGRAIADLLEVAGMQVQVMGRTARDGDPRFGHIAGIADLDSHLARADYVVLITPLTATTRGLFGAAQFEAMKTTARFINLGRGALVDEVALLAALGDGSIDAAASDVFQVEPLPEDSPMWSAPNLIVSPHMSGDVGDYHRQMARQFMHNFDAYRGGRPLTHVVDKSLGFVTG